MDYATVIVTYNRLEKLKTCISRVLAQEAVCSHIIIVDNASTDGTKEYLDETYGPDDRFIILHNMTNTGGAGGFALGCSKARTLPEPWVLLIDDDAYLRPDYMQHIAGAEKTTQKTGAFAGIVLEGGNIAPMHRRNMNGRVFVRDVPVPLSAYDLSRFNCDLATFCGLVVHKKLIAKVGLPRADFFLWMDDTEYCLRLRQYTKIMVVPGAVIDHDTVPSDPEANTLRFFPFSWREYFSVRNLLIVSGLYFPLPAYLLRIGFVLVRIAKQVLWFITSRGSSRRDATANIRLLAFALFDGIRNDTNNKRYIP